VVDDQRDAGFMERALLLAERGRGRTAPNPVVGAVVVSPTGVIVGQGAHLQAGGPHAEVVALDSAGALAEGATLYCTLEPCCHTGRTGPCVDRIIAAGVRRVVMATRDPNPRVAGRGAAALRAHGIDVREGVAEAQAVRQNAPFFFWVAQHRPLVTIKAAASADGFVGRPGERVRLTGPEADRFFHRQRAAIDAIAVGSGTMLADDPRLTAREAYRHRPLTRVIFDWRMRVTASARVWSTLEAGPVIMMVSRHEAAGRPEAAAALERAGAVVVPFESKDLAPMLADLAARDVTWLLVEGGPSLHAEFFKAGLVDQVQLAVVPRVLESGIPLQLGDLPGGSWERPTRVTPLGNDVLVEFDVHRPD
jgi:diaminohydroxyphosphoribosylaminopyrimidine deaminase / 5-amino-6-(5-phosphoribosylamino)uracil reductase